MRAVGSAVAVSSSHGELDWGLDPTERYCEDASVMRTPPMPKFKAPRYPPSNGHVLSCISGGRPVTSRGPDLGP